MKPVLAIWGVMSAALLLGTGQPQPESSALRTPPPAPPPPTAKDVHQRLTAEGMALSPLVRSEFAKAFLDAAASLPEVEARSVYRNADRTIARSAKQYEALPDADKAAFAERKCDPTFYYYTGYGSPLAYVRALDLLATHDKENWSKDKLAGKRVIDYGYGTIGHLRLLGSLGINISGIEYEPMFEALYCEPSDTGRIKGHPGFSDGYIRLLTGQWPADKALVEAVKTVPEASGSTPSDAGYDLFMSKNTLKRGYIHPARDADPRRLIHLGVDDETYLRHVYELLKPGGVFLIYNICPAQSPPDKPYIPHADGECPFDRKLLEKVGFHIVELDRDDTEGVLDMWSALKLDNGKARDEVKKDLRAWWTMVRK